jgi:septum site-determining protein MinD
VGKVILFASGKGGTGKTTAVAAIGSYLTLSGHSVIRIDADPLGALDLALGLQDAAVVDLGDAVSGVAAMSEVLTLGADGARFAKLGAVPPKFFNALFDNLRKRADYILADAPAGQADDEGYAAIPADALVLVVTPDDAAYRAAAKTRDGFDGVEPYLIVNRVKPRFLKHFRRTLDDAIDNVGAKLVGWVPEDARVKYSFESAVPLALYKSSYPLSGAQKAFRQIAERISRNI